MRHSHSFGSKRSLFSRIVTIGMLLLLIISISMNIFLLSSFLHSPAILVSNPMEYADPNNCEPNVNVQPPNDSNPTATPDTNHTIIQPKDMNEAPSKEDDICHFHTSLEHKVYIYDLPWSMREEPRMRWYEMFNKQSHASYNDTTRFNFGFGDALSRSFESGFHSTHMHSLEIILNERFKKATYYLTDNPDEAILFHIPFPFAQHFRYYHRSDHDYITGPHQEVYDVVSQTEAFTKYFSKKPHFLVYGRIAYETGRMGRLGSKFWSLKEGDIHSYWHVSIDRNCHGDPPACVKRISMPHPSNFHPTNVKALKERIDTIKLSWAERRQYMLAFCGAVRTPLRRNAMKMCNIVKYNRWGMRSGHRQLCVFEDSVSFEQRLKKKGISNQSSRKRSVEVEYGTKCLDLYDKAKFCLQDGADSTTRKALWDGIIAGCIPVFLSGVMTAEFECFAGNLEPWYIVLQPEYYLKQLLSLPKEYIQLVRKNVLRLIPKILYTNGNAGFSDAFDVLLHCIMRKTSFENQIDNPGCTMEHVIKQRKKLYDFDKMLGYDKLYEYLEI
eukprot:603849_1